MKELAVTFNNDEVNSIRLGQKTQLRRVVKPNKWAKEYWDEAEQLINAGTHYVNFAYKTTTHARAERENNFVVQREQVSAGTTAAIEAMAYDTLLHLDYQAPPINCPFGQVGDYLWVRESWSTHACFDDISPKYLTTCSIHYWANGNCQTGKKRPSTQMPRWASRIDLEIIKIRIERLNDISESDAIAEGCFSDPCDHARQICEDIGCCGPTSKGHFKHTWESINGANSWDINPWVWVVEFKVIQGGAS